MENRVPTHPNRYKAYKEDGSFEVITLERYDEPVEVGTPLNKATLLTDETALLLGLEEKSERTVNNALIQAFTGVNTGNETGELEDVMIEFGLVDSVSATSTAYAPATVDFKKKFRKTPNIFFSATSDTSNSFSFGVTEISNESCTFYCLCTRSNGALAATVTYMVIGE
ncbi:MAG: hypothetical protein R3Y09_13230 [Clostridia bacterium]